MNAWESLIAKMWKHVFPLVKSFDFPHENEEISEVIEDAVASEIDGTLFLKLAEYVYDMDMEGTPLKQRYTPDSARDCLATIVTEQLEHVMWDRLMDFKIHGVMHEN